ncbi:MAG: hypothetical protein ACHQ7N_08830 [Candidatus Methylomirabilales bacterium]
MDQWRVFLAEDETYIAQMTLDMLAELPLAVSLAKDGPDALRQAQATLPDPMLLEASGRRSAFWRAF